MASTPRATGDAVNEGRAMAGVGVFATLLCLPILVAPMGLPTTEDPDAIQQLGFAYVLHDAVWSHGELPLWNPYFGGGVRWAGYVYNPGLSPIGAVYLLAGDVVGIKLLVWAAMILGGVGMYLVARRFLGVGQTGALFAGALYLASTWMPGRLASGNYDELALFAWPISLVALDALRRGRWSGAWLPVWTLTAFAQAKYAALLTLGAGLPLVLLAAHRPARARLRDSALWLAAFGVGVLLSLPKLLPLLPLLAMDRVEQTAYRSGAAYGSLGDALHALVTTSTLRPAEHDSMAVGALALGVAVVGAVLARRRMAPVLVLGTTALLFALGTDAPVPLAELFAPLPILGTLNSFSKYFNVFVLSAVCWLAGEGLAQLVRRLQVRTADPAAGARVRGLLAAAAALCVALPAASSLVVYGRLFEGDAPPPVEREAFHHVAWGPFLGKLDRYRHLSPEIVEANQYFNLRRNVGTLTWYGNHVFAERARPRYVFDAQRVRHDNPEHLGLVHALPGWSAARIGSVDLSYNRVAFDYACDSPCRVVVNVNHDPNWHASTGEVVAAQGLLAVALPTARAGRVELRFRDSLFAWGCVGAVLGLALGGAGLAGLRRGRLRPAEGPPADAHAPACDPLRPGEQQA